MLTGKDVYHATRPFLQRQGLEEVDWEKDDFGQGPRAFYIDIAEKLNEQFFAPMQDQIKALERNERATFLDSLCLIGETLTDAMTVASDLQSQITALKALNEQYRAKRTATRVLLSESYAEIDVLLRMHEPTREESLRDLQQRIVAFLRSDDEPSPAQQIADMRELITDLVDGLQDCWDNEYSLEQLNDLKARTQELLGEEPATS